MAKAEKAFVTTTIRVSPRAWLLMREMAGARAIADGRGRPSAGALVEELILAEAARRATASAGV